MPDNNSSALKSTTSSFHIGFPPTKLAENDTFVNALTELINNVYTVAEEGIFDPAYRRTFPAEVKQCIHDEIIAVASTSSTSPFSDPANLVGSIRINKLSDTMGNFGTMVAAPQCRGTGLGRQLVEFAENHCKGWGASTMQIELLVPTDFEHKLKVWVQAWYERMGYVVVRVGDFTKDYPHIAPRMVTKADYKVFEKKL